MSCCRSDGITIRLFCYHRGSSQDAGRVVLKSAYATHMACVISWNKAFCVYPWALGASQTFILTCFLSARERRQLESWLAAMGGAGEVHMDSRYLGHSQDVEVCRWWCVKLPSRFRKLRRYVFLLFLCEYH